MVEENTLYSKGKEKVPHLTKENDEPPNSLCPCLSEPESNGVCQLHIWQGIKIFEEKGVGQTTKFLGAKNTKIKRKGGHSEFKNLMYLTLNLSWLSLLAAIISMVVFFTATFGVMYYYCGSFDSSKDLTEMKKFWRSFDLSLQTLTTIGYGTLSPGNRCGNWVVVLEAFVAMLGISFITGTVFAKFAKPRAKVLFSKHFVICQMKKQLVLAFRLVNATGSTNVGKNEIMEACFRVTMIRVERTKNGERILCQYNLPLIRENFLSLRLVADIIHVVDEASPFYGMNHQEIEESDFRLYVVMSGVDSTLHDTIYEKHVYYGSSQMYWGQKFERMITRKVVIDSKTKDRRTYLVVDFDCLSALEDDPFYPYKEIQEKNRRHKKAMLKKSAREAQEKRGRGEAIPGATLKTNEDFGAMNTWTRNSTSNIRDSHFIKRDSSRLSNGQYGGVDPFFDELQAVRKRRNRGLTATMLTSGGNPHPAFTTTTFSEHATAPRMSFRSSLTSESTRLSDADTSMLEEGDASSTVERNSDIAILEAQNTKSKWAFWRKNESNDFYTSETDYTRKGSSENQSNRLPSLDLQNHPGIRLWPTSSLYYKSLESSWIKLLLCIMVVYIAVNAFFAGISLPYNAGVLNRNATELTGFEVAFFFSVQTISTIGFGEQSPDPENRLLNFFVFLEAMLGIAAATLFTGITWSKFSIPSSSSIEFSKCLLITKFHNKACLMIRAGNSRKYGEIIEGSFRIAAIMMNEETGEREIHDVPLISQIFPVFQWSSTVVHIIDERSPFHGLTLDDIYDKDMYIVVLFTGLDTTLNDSVFARKTYVAEDVRWGHHFVDNVILKERRVEVDFTKMSATEVDGFDHIAATF